MGTHAKTLLFATLLNLVGFTVAYANTEIDASAGCKDNPAVVGQCFVVKGTISLHNGTPSMRIHPDKGRRILAVEPAENEIAPPGLKEKISFDRDIHASLLVCPLSPRKKGTMQSVCIESAKNIEMHEK